MKILTSLEHILEENCGVPLIEFSRLTAGSPCVYSTVTYVMLEREFLDSV